MVRTEVRLTEKQLKVLKRMAAEENVSLAELVRRSVGAYIARRLDVSPAERRRRLLSIVGISNSGLTDLAENHDEYLDEIYVEGHD